MNGQAYSKKFNMYIDYGVLKHLRTGGQYVYRFPNGYGASVLPEERGPGVEIAVIRFTGNHFVIVEDTHIADDVLRHVEDVDAVLEQVKELE